MIHLKTPFTREDLKDLKAGDNVLISGVVYTARDAAHARLVEDYKAGRELPFDPVGACIYYVGPTPTAPGEVIGSAGPTSSYRMDPFSPTLMDWGVKGMIGKGRRNEKVIDKIKETGSVYFAAIGGAAAIIKDRIKECDIIAYEDLGAEAFRRLVVEDFPATVIIDSNGNNLYEIGVEEYLNAKKDK